MDGFTKGNTMTEIEVEEGKRKEESRGAGSGG
jgi:hypothetical protein